MQDTNELYRLTQHSIRVKKISYNLTLYIGLDEITAKKISIAGLLHDIGKVKLDSKILNKKGKLSDSDWKHIKKHPQYSAEMLKELKFDNYIVSCVLSHHENSLGTGYPNGLVNREIPIGAKIIHICDVFDALTSNRAYRKKYSLNEALFKINQEKDLFDPNVFEQFKSMVNNKNKALNIV